MKSLLVQFIFIFFSSISAFSQSGSITLERMAAGETNYEYIRESGGSSSAFGAIRENITLRTDGIYEVVFTQELPNVTMVDSVLLRSGTMYPVRYRSHVPDMQEISIRYQIPGNAYISIKRDIPGQTADTSMVVKLQPPVYDLHWPHLITGFFEPVELNEQLVINLPVFTYNTKQQMQQFNYTGLDTLTLQNDSYETLVWSTVSPSGAENTYWIDTRLRRLVQSRARLNDGTIFWIRRK